MSVLVSIRLCSIEQKSVCVFCSVCLAKSGHMLKTVKFCSAIECKDIACDCVRVCVCVPMLIMRNETNSLRHINNYEFHIRFHSVTQSNKYFAKLISFKFPHAFSIDFVSFRSICDGSCSSSISFFSRFALFICILFSLLMILYSVIFGLHSNRIDWLSFQSEKHDEENRIRVFVWPRQ